MSEKILLVDDSAAIRQSVSFVLEQNGYEVILAEDGAIGLEKLAEHDIGLVITDVNMPNMDGITMIEKLREIEKLRFIPVLVLTTESQTSIMDRGKQAGATGWIVKPFSNEKLLATVKKVLG
jgi:two-component system chemotaxis response regulator CheY